MSPISTTSVVLPSAVSKRISTEGGPLRVLVALLRTVRRRSAGIALRRERRGGLAHRNGVTVRCEHWQLAFVRRGVGPLSVVIIWAIV